MVWKKVEGKIFVITDVGGSSLCHVDSPMLFMQQDGKGSQMLYNISRTTVGSAFAWQNWRGGYFSSCRILATGPRL